MAEIEFSVLQQACCYADIFIKNKKDKTNEFIFFCTNDNRVHSESKNERYCCENKCPLLIKKSKCESCLNNNEELSSECYNCAKGIEDNYVKI